MIEQIKKTAEQTSKDNADLKIKFTAQQQRLINEATERRKLAEQRQELLSARKLEADAAEEANDGAPKAKRMITMADLPDEYLEGKTSSAMLAERLRRSGIAKAPVRPVSTLSQSEEEQTMRDAIRI